MAEGKAIFDRAITNQDIDDALAVFNKALAKSTSSNQISQSNQLYHLRGLCYFRLRQFEQAEKDFQEAVMVSDDKSKPVFYNSLGKCKMQLALNDPAVVSLSLFSTNKRSNALKRCFSSAIEVTARPSSILGWFTER